MSYPEYEKMAMDDLLSYWSSVPTDGEYAPIDAETFIRTLGIQGFFSLLCTIKAKRDAATKWAEESLREESSAEHIARDIREGRFPGRSKRQPAAKNTAGETGWLIERGDSDPAEPWYWAAGQRDAERSSAWTQNHMQAIRFARKDDAEKVQRRLFKAIAVRVAAHEWTAR